MHLDYIEIEMFLKYNYRFQIPFLFLVHFLGQFTRNYTQTTKQGLLTTNKG